MNPDRIGESLERCFVSLSETDSNGADANVVDVINRVAVNLGNIADAITPPMPTPGRTASGVYVGCLTEAVVATANSLHAISQAILELAAAVREKNS